MSDTGSTKAPKPKSPRAQRRKASLSEAEPLAHEFVKEFGPRLVGNRDFSLFGKIATWDPKDLPGAAPASHALIGAALFKLLQYVVGVLGPANQEATADAIDHYVADAMRAAPPHPGQSVEDLATEAGVIRFLQPETREALGEISSPSSATAASTGAAPPAGADAQSLAAKATTMLVKAPVGDEARDYVAPSTSAGAADEGAEAAASTSADGRAETTARTSDHDNATGGDVAAVSYEQIRQSCLSARRLGRKVVIVVGLATSGKSFFVGRLFQNLRTRYAPPKTLRGLTKIGKKEIGRTKEVLLYRMERIAKRRSPDNFEIFDIPGDQFGSLVRNGFMIREEDRDLLKLIYAILAFADAIFFIAPAIEVLKRELYLAEGDDLGLTRAEREGRLEDIDLFIQSLDPMTRVMGLLRERMDAAQRKVKRVKGEIARATALEAAADEVVEGVLAMDFQTLQDNFPKSERLNMPAMLLLSSADVLRARLDVSRDRFDADPCYQLLLRGREHLDNLAARFEVFSVDFLTAVDGHRPGNDFEPKLPGYGGAKLVEKWLLPAINACRWPTWMRFLQTPTLALWLRRQLDPAFGRIWRSDAAGDV